MKDTFKITMLGASESGKTCYLTSMFGMMQVGYNGFTLRAADHDLGLKLNNDWEKLLTANGKDRFPAPNGDKATLFRLKFCYALNPIMSFDWLDYRGGALSDNAGNGSVKDLLNHLLSSSCTFITIPADFLLKPLTPASIHRIAQGSKLTRILDHLARLRETVKPTQEKPIPVVIVLTKFDKLVNAAGETIRPDEEIIDDVQRLCQPLFAPNSGFLVMLSKVSLGPELDQDIEHGTIDPQKVHIPIVFATYRHLHDLLVELRRAEQDASYKAGRKRSLWERFTDYFVDNDETPEKAAERLAFIRENMTGIRESLELLASELDREHMYLSGKEV